MAGTMFLRHGGDRHTKTVSMESGLDGRNNEQRQGARP